MGVSDEAEDWFKTGTGARSQAFGTPQAFGVREEVESGLPSSGASTQTMGRTPQYE